MYIYMYIHTYIHIYICILYNIHIYIAYLSTVTKNIIEYLSNMFTAKKNGGSIFSLGQADWKAAGSTGQILCQRMVLFMCTVDSMSQDKLGSCKCGSSHTCL